MPIVKLSKKVFEKLIGKKIPLNELKKRIPYLGTDLDSIKGNEINIEIFPNRPDLLSEQGFARAFSSFIGVKTGFKKYNVKKSAYKVIIDPSVSSIRPFTACAVVKNLKFDDEMIKEVIQIQEKLHITYGRNRKKAAIGIYPFEKITTPIYYKALPPEDIKFRPLESDKEMTGLQILSKHPTGREYAPLLEGKEKFPVFLDAENKILSMPPIINSYETGKITSKTRDVFIECSGFDFKTLNILLNIIVTALADMGGDIYSMELYYKNKKYTTPNLKPIEMKVDLAYVNRLLGLDLKEKELKNLFGRMGYSYNHKKVLVPAYRSDILHPIDLVEDLAIAYGYENFKPEIPNISTIGEEDGLEVFKGNLKEILIGLGLLETSSFIITSKELIEKTKMKDDLIEIKNPISQEFNVLRASLIPSMLQILSKNKHAEYPQKIFEQGLIVKKDLKDYEYLTILTANEKANYTEIRQILDALLSSLNLKYSIEDLEHNSFIPGRIGKIIVNKKEIGFLGEIHPSVLENFSLENPAAALEINLSELSKLI